MDEISLLSRFELTADWIHTFVTESNLIDPQLGSSVPGTPLYDNHRDALLYALHTAADDRYALPTEVHKLLMRGSPLAGALRTQSAKIGINDTLAPQFVKRELWRWNRNLCQAIDLLRTDDDSIPEIRKKSDLWGLHFELLNIRPYETCNGKVGRVLMVNHALLVDLAPWIIPSKAREEYFNGIRRHPSANWGANPPEDQL